MTAVYKGDMPCSCRSPEKPRKRCDALIKNVYYHERIEANLLAWDRLRRQGWELRSSKRGTYVTPP